MRPRTLATRFLLVVALGAVLPLALVGLWLTRSAQRSGTALLRSQIERAADVIIASIDRRWTLRDGELQLLAANTVAPNVVRGVQLAAEDSVYLIQMAQSLSGSVQSITYLDASGRERWSFVRATTTNRTSDAASGFSNALPRTLPAERPVIVHGHPVGRVVVRITVSSVIAPETGQGLLPGAIVTIADARGIHWTNASEPVDLDSPTATRDAGLEVVSRRARVAPLRVTVAAPSGPYVTPFERAARAGLGVLMAVAVVVLAASIILIKRVTASLERLSAAATAVAAGDLQRTVHETTDDEVGRLASAFNTMTESLRRTVGELAQQRALAAVGEFAASLSHEVRNSLTAVRVDLQHAGRHLPNDSAGTPLVARALESVRRLDATVSGALRVARGGQLTPSPVDLGDVLRRAMSSAEPSFLERGARLEPMAAQATPTIRGDAGALEQLFLNLLINAAQASPDGGHAHVELSTSPSHVTIKVIDGGAGIGDAATTLGGMSRSTKPNGTGLGLPIARRIAIAHGGELAFETGLDAGTTAVVRLPIAAPSTAGPALSA